VNAECKVQNAECFNECKVQNAKCKINGLRYCFTVRASIGRPFLNVDTQNKIGYNINDRKPCGGKADDYLSRK